MVKKYYTYDDVHNAAMHIVLQMYKDNWRPDYVVGITRGGLPLALRISNLLDCRMETLKVKLRDGKPGEECESNCWMAEDAFGYEHYKILEHNADISASAGEPIVDLPISKKNILIVDDINDTGATFNWIKQDWPAGCLPDDPNWDTVWGQNVRFAAMFEKSHTEFDGLNYMWKELDTSEGDPWVVFPWELSK
jgi:hypoxanthine phosphoribosyltransferase